MSKSDSKANPLILQRADPWIFRHSDGYYYFIASVPEFDRIELRCADTIEALNSAEAKVLWRKKESGPLSANIWAPEIHFLEGKWYIYFAATWSAEPIGGIFDHRIFVLENESANPMEGEWVEKGQLKTHAETFCLDATTLTHKGKTYLVWAQKDMDIEGNSNLYICPMANPWTLEGEPVMLTKPELDWEVIGFKVNEGPACIVRNGKVIIVYSASATDYNYCMGLIWADTDADLMNPSSWTKSEKPCLTTNAEIGVFGPGHNSFTTDKDGTDILVYHARPYRDVDLDKALSDPNRHCYVAPFDWDDQGLPLFRHK